MSEAVSLRVAGKTVTGWTSVEVVDSIEALSPTFALEYSDAAAPALRIEQGEVCTVEIDGETVITGYVDDPEAEETETERTLTVTGRSKTCDLVDCSALRKPPSWKSAKLDAIATDLCKPFGLAVSVGPGIKLGDAFPRFAIEPGETVLECLSRAARQRGLILRSTPAGDLQIATVGATRMGAPLERGKTIKRARRGRSLRERYSEIRVRSQSSEEGLFGTTQSQVEAKASDDSVPRYRPLVVLADCADSKLATRAAWEVSSRLGKGSRVSVLVHGWKHGGELWRPNALVRFKYDWLGLDDELLVATVRLSLDAGGRLTELDLCSPAAFAPEPPPKPKAKAETSWP